MGRVIVVSSPSGAGKTTLINKLLEEFPDKYVRSISCTTRSPRAGEVDGKDYIFVSPEKFQNFISDGLLLEYTNLFGYMYGTLKDQVNRGIAGNKDIILVIDVQGAKAIEGISDLSIFILPPSMEELSRRLCLRGEGHNTNMRINRAPDEIKQRQCYNHVISNNDLLVAYNELKKILVGEWEG